MPIDLSRLPSNVRASLTAGARLLQQSPDPTPAEAAAAISVYDWVVSVDRLELPCIVSLPTPDLSPKFGDFIATPLLVRLDGLMHTAHGWMRLEAHGVERDPLVIRGIIFDLQVTSIMLRAALLEERS